MDRWAWEQLDPWIEIRRELPIGALLASVVLLLSGYVRNEATLTADLTAGEAITDNAMSGYARLLATLTSPDSFPAIHALLAAGVFDKADDPDDEFSFGLERILDGIDGLVRTRGLDERTEPVS